MSFHRCHVHVRTEAKSLRARPKYACRSLTQDRFFPVLVCARWALSEIALEPCRLKTWAIGMPTAEKTDVQTSLKRQCLNCAPWFTMDHCKPGLSYFAPALGVWFRPCSIFGTTHTDRQTRATRGLYASHTVSPHTPFRLTPRFASHRFSFNSKKCDSRNFTLFVR